MLPYYIFYQVKDEGSDEAPIELDLSLLANVKCTVEVGSEERQKELQKHRQDMVRSSSTVSTGRVW
jgi:hypothetical protein